jgi:hypothetical protein
MFDQKSIQTVRREAEEIRSAVFAQAAQILFGSLIRPIIALHGSIYRAQTVQQAIAFDDNWLAEFGARRANIPAYVAGQVNPVYKSAVKRTENSELRQAA